MRASKIAMVIGGTLTALLAACLLTAGAWAFWADTARADDAGYIATDEHRIQTVTHALATDDLDVRGDNDWVADHALNLLELRFTAAGEGPLFVGIARTDAVAAYLAGVEYDEVSDVETDPFAYWTERHDGSRQPAPPASETFWAASAQGTGTQTLEWEPEDGNWSVVVMNPDGSAGVDADVSFGVRVPALFWIGLGSSLVGLLLTASSVFLLYAGMRRQPRPPVADTPDPAPAA